MSVSGDLQFLRVFHPHDKYTLDHHVGRKSQSPCAAIASQAEANQEKLVSSQHNTCRDTDEARVISGREERKPLDTVIVIRRRIM